MNSVPILALAAAVTSASAAEVVVHSGGQLIVKSQITATGDGISVESGGELQLQGILNSPVQVASGGKLSITGSGTDVASVQINGGLTLGGTLGMRFNESNGSPTCDHISGLTSVSMGGILELQPMAVGATLTAGQSIDLWDSALTTGTAPQITGITLADGLFFHSDGLQTQGSLSVSIAPETYQQWMTTYVTAGDTSNDINHDGVADFMEFSLGINPQGGGNTLPTYEVEHDSSGTALALIVHLPVPSPPSVVYTVEASDNLETSGWESIAQRTGNGEWSGSATITSAAAENGIQTFHIRDVVVPDSTRIKKFIRLRVE
ncbi:MAG: hypothetical protein ABI162_06095 [Luteolibacter sp.]